MKQVRRFTTLLLAVVLTACSNGQQTSNNGVARIRATAIAAQQRDASREATRPTPAPVDVGPQAPSEQPTSIAAPQAQPAANTSTAWQSSPTDEQQLDLIAALGIIFLTFAFGCVVGSIVTAYMLGQKEAKRGSIRN